MNSFTKLCVFFLVQSCTISFCFAQKKEQKNIHFSGYIEAYYQEKLTNTSNNSQIPFLYNHTKNNNISVNLAFVKMAYQSTNTRANIALMMGDYATNNLAEEPTIFKPILEASVGVKLSKKSNIWLDVGVMPSHIGLESAIGKDCFTTTRSIVAENSPYYETGLKLSTTNKKETISYSLLVLNGWQKIETPVFTKYPSLGFQFQYKPNENTVFNYSNFIGIVNPIYNDKWRHYHNLYFQKKIKNSTAVFGVDMGNDKNTIGNIGWWFSPIILLKQKLNNKINVAGRVEYFIDNQNIILPNYTSNQNNILGLSLNVDYNFNKYVMVRIEGKHLSSSINAFDNSMASKRNTIIGVFNIAF